MNEHSVDDIKSGVSESTPSKSLYFSWINSTNEGPSEKQTLANLEYFRYLKEEYGMQLDIYAWDAGNLDGAEGTYETLDSEKIKAQYPNGYRPVSDAAKKLGIKLGVWCGPDGYGETEEDAEKRRELLVSLCRDHNFALFKMDAVCSRLRPEKQHEMVKTMEECRKYSPELILLNHRLNLGKAMPYATTFLWNGLETYVDVHIGNGRSAPHHRAFIFGRGNVPELKRLAEDHGVCISSCPGYFEDDLIYQAFGRCLILAPEIYGNPWLLRDYEQTRLARIFNLHRHFRDILVSGILLPEEIYGPGAVSRGNGKTRLITTGNSTWETQTVRIKLDEEIGLERCDYVNVICHFPLEKYAGTFEYGETAEIEVPPFRASLIEISVPEESYPVLEGCLYEVIHEKNGLPDKVKIVSKNGDISKIEKGQRKDFPCMNATDDFDNNYALPEKISGEFFREDIPDNIEELFEYTQFVQDNDSLERRALRRAGESRIPEVNAARDAFFSQRTYITKGCESSFAFDGKDETFFDGGVTKTYYGGCMREFGSSLRIDFGDIYDADSIILEFFEGDYETPEVKKQEVSEKGYISSDLKSFSPSSLKGREILLHLEENVVVNDVHNIIKVPGRRTRVTYEAGGRIRYFKCDCAPDRIYKAALIKEGKEVKLSSPKIQVLLPPYSPSIIKGIRRAHIKFPEKVRDNSYISIGIEGDHGEEGVYALLEIGGKYYPCPDRAPSYKTVAWECAVSSWYNSGYTYYLGTDHSFSGKEADIILIECSEEAGKCEAFAYLCEDNHDYEGVITDF